MKETTLLEAAKRMTMAVVAREVLRDVAPILGAERIDLMPLKGVLLHALVYTDPAERPLVDVDVAVRWPDFDRAQVALVRAGYQVVWQEPGRYEVSLRSERFPLCVDLHRSFAATRRFRLTPDAMFTRGERNDTLFGCRVILPDDYDLYAHLLAHGGLDWVSGLGWQNPGDLDRVAVSRHLNEVTCARRLEEHGLSRFARVVLSPGAAASSRFGDRVLANLAPDPLGSALAAAAHRMQVTDAPQLLRRAVAVLLNPTLAEAALALVEAGARRIRPDVARRSRI